jgi:tripartite-type tricarboxylate transporter receptor subunit TctC
VMYTNPTSGLPLAKTGKLKLLASTGPTRLRTLLDLPTVSETVPGYDHGNTSGIYGPAGIPSAIAVFINREVSKAVNSPDIKSRIEADGSEIAGPHSPAEFKDRFFKRVAQWEDFINNSGIKLGK